MSLGQGVLPCYSQPTVLFFGMIYRHFIELLSDMEYRNMPPYAER